MSVTMVNDYIVADQFLVITMYPIEPKMGSSFLVADVRCDTNPFGFARCYAYLLACWGTLALFLPLLGVDSTSSPSPFAWTKRCQ